MTISFPPFAVSPVLREVAELKTEELSRAREAFKGRYEGNLDIKAAGDDVLKRLSVLLERIKKLDPYLEKDDDLPIFSRYIEQAQNDHSVSQTKLLRLEKDLLDKLEKHSNRLEVSSLHVELLKEALDAEDSSASLATRLEKAVLDDEFELVEGELEAVFDQFEKNTFSNKDVNTKALEDYLDNLFESSAAKEELNRLRCDMEEYGDEVMAGQEEVNEEIVAWCIIKLLQNDLVSDEKKKTLQGYLQNPIAMNEIRGTLNMKSVRHWNWRNSEKGLPVTARQNAEGKYCITVEEDIIDMLFLNSLSVGWSMKLKECLNDAVSFKGIWPGNTLLTAEELEKREYYLLPPRPKTGSCTTCHPPPPPPPPPILDTVPRPPRCGYVPPPPPPPPPVFKPKKKGKMRFPLPPPPIPVSPNLNDERYRSYIQDFFLSRLPERDGSSPKSNDPEEMQAILLKTLATEAKLREVLDGSAYTMTANFSSFSSSLPHQTILAVLKFLGVPQQWLDVFSRFLAAPLNVGPVVRGTSDQILTRTCGVPVAHGFETFFGEAILFFLDLVVHQKTGAYLFRLRDRCYFVGKEQQCKDTVQEISKFADAMGLDVRVESRLDTEAVSFVALTATAEGILPKIENAKVEAYARRVKKQLAACSTVIEWIRTWNGTVGTYASHLFGPLANVFGKTHLEAVTQAYNGIHDIIFDGSNLTDHVKHLLIAHLNHTLSDPPFALEALLYLPHAYGGLGIKNPYITINLAREMFDKPNSKFEEYIEAEQKYYNYALENFNRMTPEKQQNKLKSIFHDDKGRIAKVLGTDTDPTIFPSFEQISANRERATYPFLRPPRYPAPSTFIPTPALIPVYNDLLEEPEDHIIVSEKILNEVRELSGKLDMKNWYRLSGEERWVVQMYGDECFERYGGLECWHGESVPMDVLKLVRGEMPDVEDDASSTVSSVSI